MSAPTATPAITPFPPASTARRHGHPDPAEADRRADPARGGEGRERHRRGHDQGGVPRRPARDRHPGDEGPRAPRWSASARRRARRTRTGRGPPRPGEGHQRARPVRPLLRSSRGRRRDHLPRHEWGFAASSSYPPDVRHQDTFGLVGSACAGPHRRSPGTQPRPVVSTATPTPRRTGDADAEGDASSQHPSHARPTGGFSCPAGYPATEGNLTTSSGDAIYHAGAYRPTHGAIDARPAALAALIRDAALCVPLSGVVAHPPPRRRLLALSAGRLPPSPRAPPPLASASPGSPLAHWRGGGVQPRGRGLEATTR